MQPISSVKHGSLSLAAFGPDFQLEMFDEKLVYFLFRNSTFDVRCEFS